MEEIQIRTAAEEDAGALLEIYAPYVRDTAVSFELEAPTVEEFRDRIASTLRRYPYLVAEQRGQILGYAYAGPVRSRAAFAWCAEMSVYVDAARHREGIGRRLYAALEQALREMGIMNLYACVAYAEKEDERLTHDSLRFHERMGYAPAGHFRRCGYKFGRWYDMLWLEKIIGEHPIPAEDVRAYRE